MSRVDNLAEEESETSLKSKVEYYFLKKFQLRCLIGFWTRLCSATS